MIIYLGVLLSIIAPVILVLIGIVRLFMKDLKPGNTKWYFIAALVSLIIGWGSCGLGMMALSHH